MYREEGGVTAVKRGGYGCQKGGVRLSKGGYAQRFPILLGKCQC